jgi:putative ABC transport system permease protein
MSQPALPLVYNWRNLFGRRISTSMTVLGIALVVAVFLLVLSLAEGVRKTFASPVSSRAIVALRVGAQSDAMSVLSRSEYENVRTLPGIEQGSTGQPLVSPEIVVLINRARRDGKKTNVIVRGVEPVAFALRPALRIVEGRTFRPGTNEAIVSRRTQERFAGIAIGEEIRSGRGRWTVVGLFDSSGSPYDSEIWADLGNVQAQSRREGILSVVRLRAREESDRERLMASIREDQRIKLEAKTEAQYFAEQSGTAKPIEFLAYLVGIIMAIGASFGAMNTMYAQVTARTREIATLRAVGFSRPGVLASFVAESVALALLGGVLGAVAAFLVVRTLWAGTTGTQNFATFAEILFHFELTPSLILRGLLYAVAIGFLGGLFPAIRASRMPIVSALRQG